jgi:hypothetical protein
MWNRMAVTRFTPGFGVGPDVVVVPTLAMSSTRAIRSSMRQSAAFAARSRLPTRAQTPHPQSDRQPR